MNTAEGKELVKYARKVIEAKLEDKKIPELKKFEDKQGVFVTLTRRKELRGCVGFTQPVMPLREALKNAALSAAFQDPRFLPVRKGEMDDVTVEISVLTKPQEIKVKTPKEYPEKIKIGEDGLIADCGFASGLLLPQVAVENNWDAEEFLNNTCWKANMQMTEWLSGKIKIYKFQAQIYKEKEPNGEVVEEKLE